MTTRDAAAAEREREPAVRAGGQPGPVPAGMTGLVLGLQSAAGNRAVSRMPLMRTPGPPSDPAAATTVPAASPAGAPGAWDAVWDFAGDHGLDLLRMGFEVGRLVPAVGLWSGMAADCIGWWGDYSAQLGLSAEGNDPVLLLATTFRNELNLVNNGVGALLYVTELAEGGAAVSVVGVELVPFIALVAEAGTAGKLVMDVGQTFLDALIGARARADELTAADPKDAEIFHGLWTGYAANFLGDVFTDVVDILGFLSAGAAQNGAVGQASEAVEGIVKTGVRAKDAIISLLGSLWNVWGGAAIGPAAPSAASSSSPAGTVARVAAADDGGGARWAADVAELESVSRCVDRGDEVIGTVAGLIGERMADAQAIADALQGGGREAFETLRDSASRALDEARSRVGALGEAEALTLSAEEGAQLVSTTVEGLLGDLDALRMPEIEVPTHAEIGDDALSDVVEGVADTVAGAADAGVQALLDQIRGALESGKDALRAPLEAILEQADEAGRSMALMAEGIRMQIADAEALIGEIESAVAQADSVPEMLDGLLGEALELAGLPEGTTVSGLASEWAALAEPVAQALDRARAGLAAASPGEPGP